MSGEGRTVRLFHLVGVAVVGGQNQNAVHLFDGLGGAAHAGVHRFHRFDGRIHESGMAHHIAVGVVEDDHVVFARADALAHRVAHLIGAHFRL